MATSLRYFLVDIFGLDRLGASVPGVENKNFSQCKAFAIVVFWYDRVNRANCRNRCDGDWNKLDVGARSMLWNPSLNFDYRQTLGRVVPPRDWCRTAQTGTPPI